MHVSDVEQVTAWQPAVPGIAEVLHARFVEHIYPPHTHDTWTVLLVDEGTVRYDLEHREHGAVRGRVTLLPPHVAHTGRAGTSGGFRKRVLYVETALIDQDLVGAAVDSPNLPDPLLRQRISRLHDTLTRPESALEAESLLVLIASRVRELLRAAGPTVNLPRGDVAEGLRDLLDSHIEDGLTLREAGVALDAHPDHLVRAFTAAFGLPPHRYLTARRIDAARRLLLDGRPAAEVATAVGFHDQSHLTRHFAKQVGVTPARYARQQRQLAWAH